jgi:hypothetical protein
MHSNERQVPLHSLGKKYDNELSLSKSPAYGEGGERA